MSRADEIFIQNMTDIMENGYWDTDLAVRPKWEDGALSSMMNLATPPPIKDKRLRGQKAESFRGAPTTGKRFRTNTTPTECAIKRR